jgi:RHS repeat-associated protein
MAGNRPADWHVLDLDKDPTPGDPDRVRNLAKNLHDFADDVSKVLRDIKGMAGEDAILTWAGKTAESFTSEFESAPGKLKKLKKSYEMAGDALSTYWPELERSQALADKALAQGREAQTSLSAAQSRLTSADSWMDRAGKEADKYKDDDGGSKAGKDVPKPDPDKVKAATRNANSAEKAQTAAKSDVSAAQSNLDAAKKMAEDARKMRENAAGTAKKKLEEASDAGIQNRKWWEEVGDWVTDNWDTIVAVCKVVVAVLGVIAMIIGGPILGAIVLIAALVVLADTLHKYANGEAGLLDVAFAALDCIPGMKGLTSLRGLAKGMKGLKAGLKGLKSARGVLAKGAKGGFNRLKSKIKGCGDPVDAATGQMFLAQTDVTLPGTLALSFTRRASSDCRTGYWFGPSWTSTIDQRIEVDEEGLVFVTDDGMLLAYPHPEAPDTPVLPEAGPRWALSRLDNGGYRIDDPVAGRSRHFAPPSDGVAVVDHISDRNRNTIHFEYDADGVPLSIRHSSGYRLRLTVRDDRVRSLSLANAAADGSDVEIKQYGYTDGNLTSVVNSSGQPLEFTYDDFLRIVAWQDTNRRSYTYTYDEQDRCVSQRGDEGYVTGSFAYDGTDPAWPDCRVTTHTTAEGATTRFVINDNCQVVAETNPLGHTAVTAYDEHHHVTSWTDALGHTTRYVNNAFGQLVEMVRPDGAVSRYTYNDLHLPTALELPDGTAWRQTYNEHGNCTSVTDPAGHVTRSVFNAHGHLLSVTDALGHTTAVRCDAAGMPVEASDPLGATTVWERSAFGLPVAVTDAGGGTTRFEWTTEGQLSRRTTPDGAAETWAYDGEGNRISHTDQLGQTTRFEYTHFDLLAARTTPDGARYQFTYDPSLRLTRVANPEGLNWTYRYDAAGRRESETDFDGRTLTYVHDAAGRLVARTNGAGETVTFERDALGQTVRKDAAGDVTTFTYDLLGHLTRAVGPESALDLRRDHFGQVTSETVDGRTMVHHYDAVGRRTERATPSGAVSAWTYDSSGRPAQLNASGRVIDFARDQRGQELSRRIGDHVTLAHTFDDLGRLTTQSVVTADGRAVQSRSYTYRADRLLVGVDDQHSGARSFGLDAAGRVTSVDGEQWGEQYAYDEAGNLTEADWPDRHPGQEATGARAYSGTRIRHAGGVRYEYDAQGRTILRQKTRLSRKPDTWRYTWDAEDHLTSVVTPDGTRWRYRYDPLGRRTAKQRLAPDGETVVEETVFTWDGSTLCEQTTSTLGLPNPVTLTWDHQGLHPISQTERITAAADATQEEIDSRFFAIVTDLVGAPTELVDEQGEVAWRSRTTLWGITAWPANSGAYTPLRFPGQYFDPETGLHYNHYRHYDPETARYLTPDPLGLGPAPNPVAYVANPLLWADPFGLAPCDVALGYRHGGTKRFAEDRGLTHYMDLGPDEWRGPVFDAIKDGSVKLHVNMKEFPADGFVGMAKRGLGHDGPGFHATEEEMGMIARSVKNGRRTWDSVKFYDKEGKLLEDVPEPDWANMGRVREFIEDLD